MMLFDEFLHYWEPAALNLYEKDVSLHKRRMEADHGLSLAADLGLLDTFKHWEGLQRDQESPMTDELRELLIKLAGPHGRTVLKAYRIQKGLHDDG